MTEESQLYNPCINFKHRDSSLHTCGISFRMTATGCFMPPGAVGASIAQSNISDNSRHPLGVLVFGCSIVVNPDLSISLPLEGKVAAVADG